MANVRRVTTVTSFFPFTNKKKALTDEGIDIVFKGLASKGIPEDAEISLQKADGGGFELVVKYEPKEVAA